MTYHPTTTALLLVDLYNNFLSEGGKIWPRVRAVAEEVKVLDHLRALVKVARDNGYRIYFVPDHR
jgi:nicotinamidase-related amidase